MSKSPVLGFVDRHIGPDAADVTEMLRTMGKASLDDLLQLAVENEKAALAIYTDLLEMVQDETHLRVLFENQVLAEREHFEELSKMLRR